jgi:hypothetical protein
LLSRAIANTLPSPLKDKELTSSDALIDKVFSQVEILLQPLEVFQTLKPLTCSSV